MFAFIIIGTLIFAIWYFASGEAENDKKRQEEQQKRFKEKEAELLIAKVKAGKQLTEDDYLPYEVKKMKEKQEAKEETKKIIKGAVVGGIVAGDAGAVVGATIAKNKIDKEKMKQ